MFGKVTDISLPLVADILISAALYIFFIVITKNEALGLRKKISDLFKHFRRHSETFAPLETWLQSKPSDR